MSLPKVYIIIVNYKNWQDTKDCLTSLLHASYKNFTVFIVDNNSGNQSLANLSAWMNSEKVSHVIFPSPEVITLPAQLPQVICVQNDHNSGFAGANNLILDLIKDENAFVWLLNPDMTAAPEALSHLVKLAVNKPVTTIIGATIKHWSGNRDLFFYGGGKVNYNTATIKLVSALAGAGKLDYISGGCLFTHAGNFKTIGLLPGEYFLYWEETDWCCKARQMGFELLLCSDAICYDKVSTVIGKGFLADYYYARNGLLFLSKYQGKKIPVALCFMVFRFFKRVFTGQWKRAAGIYRGTKDYLKKRKYAIQ